MFDVSIRPGAHRTGELKSSGGGGMRLAFQSAPVLIAPGNDRGGRGYRSGIDVSIRPGAHRTGEQSLRCRSHLSCRSFNPPRCSSHRGTSPDER